MSVGGGESLQVSAGIENLSPIGDILPHNEWQILYEALALVISLNVQRRDMTAGQRAIVAAKAMEQMPERRGRPEKEGKSSPNNGRSVGIVAKSFKVSDKSVQQAKSLLTDATDLAEQVMVGSPLAEAYKEWQSRQKKTAEQAKKLERAAEYREAIDAGKMTVDEALQRALDEAAAAADKAKHDAQARRHLSDSQRAWIAAQVANP